jgi:hypothetical protein
MVAATRRSSRPLKRPAPIVGLFQFPALATVRSAAWPKVLSGFVFCEARFAGIFKRVRCAWPTSVLFGQTGFILLREGGSTPSTCAGRFYGIFIGAGTFPFAQTLNLRYPESDAQTLAEAVRLGAESLCGKDKVELITLTSNNPDPAHKPTKDNIHRAFETISTKSRRGDLLFVYLSGHGAAPANDPHAYFYLTQDARQVNVEIADQLRAATTVSASELVQWLTNPSLPDKQVLILDTCAAGAANTQLAALSTRSRSAADDLKKAVDNWNLDTGTYILMGSATDRSSYESDRFRHGFLTYALLHGMKGEALLDNSRLEAAHWFEPQSQPWKYTPP